ncbi:MAG: phenylacetate--CoA ligase family protein [Oligoflexales bacterium]
MTVYDLKDIVKAAREKSPFYNQLYAKVNPKSFKIDDLPLIVQSDFWQANTVNNNRILTGPLHTGFVFKSGGTSGNPKFSPFTAEEWQTFTRLFGWGLAQGTGLEDGDRIGNLFYAGELYASFIFIMDSINNSGKKALQLPLAGHSPFSTVIQTVRDFSLTTLVGVPTSILTLTRYLVEQKTKLPSITKILYGGESCYEDQLVVIKEGFPNAIVQSVGYASVDAGHLGYFDKDCTFGLHKAFAKESIVEIIDPDTGTPISESNRPGKLYITNLTRTLMPIIRYPAGDVVQWEGPKDKGIFRILGRSEEGVRVGPVSIPLDDMRKIIQEVDRHKLVANFQSVLEHFDGMDQLTVRIYTTKEDARAAQLGKDFEKRLAETRAFLADAVRDGKIHPLKVECVSSQYMTINPRTGKIIPIIDKRLGS